MRGLIPLVLFIIAYGCSQPNTEIKIDVINNYEFMLNGQEYAIVEFEDVFALEDSKLFKKVDSKYDIILRVHKGVEMKTLQMIKVEFSKMKSHINEIKYTYEE